MNFKKISSLIVMLVMFTLVTACSNVNHENPLPGSQVDIYDPEQGVKKLSQNLNIIVPQETSQTIHNKYYYYNIKKTKFNISVIKNTLINNKKILDEKELPEVYTCTTVDNDSLTVEKLGNLTFVSDNFLNKINPSIFLNENSASYNGMSYESINELPFMTKKQAEKAVESLLKDLQIKNMKIKKTYVIDHNTLQQEHQTLLNEGKSVTIDKSTLKQVPLHFEYTEKDDCYYFILSETIDDINIISYPHGSPDDDTYVTGTTAKIVVSKRGFEYVDISGHYTISGKEPVNEIVDMEQALNVVENKFKYIILNNPITIEKISLIYVPEFINKKENKYKLTPMWFFYTTQKIISEGTDIQGEKSSFVLVNAITGKEVI